MKVAINVALAEYLGRDYLIIHVGTSGLSIGLGDDRL